MKEGDRALKYRLLSHPVLALRAVRSALHLRSVDARIGDDLEGRRIRGALNRRNLLRVLTLANSGACVLSIPQDGAEYSQGARMQTLRRKVRAAEKGGAVCRPIEDAAEQLRLIRHLDRAVAQKSDARYRKENADNSALVGIGAWMGAFDANGEPLVLSVTPRSGECALLSLYISFGETPLHSDARYSLTKAVVERLAGEGVRYLVDEIGPSELSNGLRHFQRMLGYRISRIRVR